MNLEIAVAPFCQEQPLGGECLGHPEHRTCWVNGRNRFLGSRKTRLHIQKIGLEDAVSRTATQLQKTFRTFFRAIRCIILFLVVLRPVF